VALLDIQKRMTTIAKVRLGMKTDRGAPKKLETFRVTSPSKDVVEAVSMLYGGTVGEWKPDAKAPAQWEVITDASTFDVVVAPGQVLSSFYELWNNGGCQRRCNGLQQVDVHDQPSGEACLCPGDVNDRQALAAKGQACKPTTRFQFMIRDLPVIGLALLESHGYYAAVELSGMAELLEYATKRGLYIPAKLRLDQRTSKKNGQTMRYAVPVLELSASFTQINEALGGAINTPQSLQSGQPAVAALPVAGPGPSRPALPAGERVPETVTAAPASRAPLPSSPRGRAAKVALPADRPPLPADPSFTIEASTVPMPSDPGDRPLKLVPAPPPQPSDPFEGLPGCDGPADSKRAQQLAQAARRAGIEDDTRHALVEWVTDGRTASGAEVNDDEAGRLHLLFSELKRGKRTMTFDPDGKVVGVE
jgi:hypothetical protein